MSAKKIRLIIFTTLIVLIALTITASAPAQAAPKAGPVTQTTGACSPCEPCPATCTPGFWKQPQHFQYWKAGFGPNDAYYDTGMTYLDALQGGRSTQTSRILVAAILNAANPAAPCD